MIGYGQPALRSRDEVPDHAKCFQASHLVRQTRNAEGLAKILAEYLGVPVTIDEFVPDWILLAATERTRLSTYRGNNRLGEDAIIGEEVLDAQHKIRIRLGPMSLSHYRTLLPGEPAAKQVMTWIRNYIGFEFSVDIQLVLRKEEITPVQLGHATPLGWTSWLGKDHYEMYADDLVMTDDIYSHQ